MWVIWKKEGRPEGPKRTGSFFSCSKLSSTRKNPKKITSDKWREGERGTKNHHHGRRLRLLRPVGRRLGPQVCAQSLPLGPNRLARPQDRLHRVASGSGSGVEYNPLDSSGGWYANDKFEQATLESGNAERRGRQCTSRLGPARLNKRPQRKEKRGNRAPDQGRTQSYRSTVRRTTLVYLVV